MAILKKPILNINGIQTPYLDWLNYFVELKDEAIEIAPGNRLAIEYLDLEGKKQIVAGHAKIEYGGDGKYNIFLEVSLP